MGHGEEGRNGRGPGDSDSDVAAARHHECAKLHHFVLPYVKCVRPGTIHVRAPGRDLSRTRRHVYGPASRAHGPALRARGPPSYISGCKLRRPRSILLEAVAVPLHAALWSSSPKVVWRNTVPLAESPQRQSGSPPTSRPAGEPAHGVTSFPSRLLSHTTGPCLPLDLTCFGHCNVPFQCHDSSRSARTDSLARPCRWTRLL